MSQTDPAVARQSPSVRAETIMAGVLHPDFFAAFVPATVALILVYRAEGADGVRRLLRRVVADRLRQREGGPYKGGQSSGHQPCSSGRRPGRRAACPPQPTEAGRCGCGRTDCRGHTGA